MLLPVNPNRMELLRLKKRLIYAQKGHDMLEDKLKQLLSGFLELLKKTQKLQKELEIETNIALRNLFVARLFNKKDNFLSILEKINIQTEIKIDQQLLLGTKIPYLSLEITSFSYPATDFLEWELVVKRWVDLLPKLVKFAELLKVCQLLAQEIEAIRRRVNALEYLLIPSLRQTIRYIAAKLNELERTSLIRLLRIKELIRKY